MRGYDGKTTKTNMTDEFSFGFGNTEKFGSYLDNAAKKLYEALGEKTDSNDETNDLLVEIAKYFQNCLLLDDKIKWEKVPNERKGKKLIGTNKREEKR